MLINTYTKKLVELTLEIAKAANKYHKNYFIGGGLAIDFFVGKITRNHHDIDFFPMFKDILWWRKWFEKQGYIVEDKIISQFNEIYKILDKDKKEIIDIWPFKLVRDKIIIKFNDIYVDFNKHWLEIKIVKYRGISVNIEDPNRVLDQKLRHFQLLQGQKLRTKDLHDFELLGRNPYK